MFINDRASGFYFLRESYPELVAQYPAVAKVHLDKPIVYSLSCWGHPDECAAVFLSAAALVLHFHGVAFDPQGGTVVNAKQLGDAAARCSLLPKE